MSVDMTPIAFDDDIFARWIARAWGENELPTWDMPAGIATFDDVMTVVMNGDDRLLIEVQHDVASGYSGYVAIGREIAPEIFATRRTHFADFRGDPDETNPYRAAYAMAAGVVAYANETVQLLDEGKN